MEVTRFRSPLLTLLLLFVAFEIRALDTNGWPEWNGVTPPMYPGERWLQYATPEEAGWSSEKLQSAAAMIEEAESAAVVVIYNGAVLAHWGEPSRRFMCHSMRKSILSALYGIAVDRGSIDMDATMHDLGIDDISPLSETEKQATVADLLKARSGVYHASAYSPPVNMPSRGEFAPGTNWVYQNWDFNTLSTIYNQETSSDLFEDFESKIAVPTQMQDFAVRHGYYHLEAEKSQHSAYPFRMSSFDLARFGWLFLNEGRWNDEQILPDSWVWESTRAHSTHRSGGYGYMWWTARDKSQLGKLGTYWAAGYGGQKVYVVPGANLVLVHRADTYKGNHVNDIYHRHILMKVLAARNGPPEPDPDLLPVDLPAVDVPAEAITGKQKTALVGTYHAERRDVVVRDARDRLEVVDPHFGNFYLNPKSATEFEIEDARFSLEFELDDRGQAKFMRVEINPERILVLPRQQHDDEK